MEETQNICQSSSNWGFMQNLTSWSFNDHENGEESTQNYTGGPCQWSQGSWGHSHQDFTLCHEGLKSCSTHKDPCSIKHMYRPVWSLQWFRGELGESGVVRWDQNPALWHQLNSPCLEEEECCLWPQKHHPHRQTWRWKHYSLGMFFC